MDNIIPARPCKSRERKKKLRRPTLMMIVESACWAVFLCARKPECSSPSTHPSRPQPSPSLSYVHFRARANESHKCCRCRQICTNQPPFAATKRMAATIPALPTLRSLQPALLLLAFVLSLKLPVARNSSSGILHRCLKHGRRGPQLNCVKDDDPLLRNVPSRSGS